MALHWNIGDCENHKELIICTNPSAPEDERTYRLHTLTDSLIWATMALGISKITLKNYEEFYTRLKFSEDLNGQLVRNWDYANEKAVPVTVEDIERHIGLSTNASRYSRAEFIKRQIKIWEETNKEIK